MKNTANTAKFAKLVGLRGGTIYIYIHTCTYVYIYIYICIYLFIYGSKTGMDHSAVIRTYGMRESRKKEV